MENVYGKIEEYLLGELSEGDRVEFEKALSTDAGLVIAVEAHRDVMERLEALRLRKKVKKALEEEEDDDDNDDQDDNRVNSRRNFTKYTLAILGFVLLGTAIALWFFQQKPAPIIPKTIEQPAQPSENNPTQETGKPKEMAAEEPPANQQEAAKPGDTSRRLLALARSYQQEPLTAMIRGAAEGKPDGSKTNTQLAAVQYEKGNFAAVIQLLQPDNKVTQDETALFLRASAQFKLSQYERAAADFEALNQSFQFKNEARWNTLLCQLALGKMARVQTLLSAMEADPDFAFRKKAMELKAKL